MVQYIYTIGADLISQERDGRTYTYLYDGHGSVVGLMSESGSVTDTYTYDAFGNLLKSTGRTENNYRYCGEQFDSTTGLYYLRARYMDTSTGRFISQDSYAGSAYDPVSLHKYLYANSNPVTYSDPSGYSAENDLHYYQQAWLTIDQAIEYEQQLLCSSCNEIAYNAKVLEIGREIIHQLTMTAIEYALASFLEDYVDPQTAREIANGVVTALDLALKGRNNAIDEKLGVDANLTSHNPYGKKGGPAHRGKVESIKPTYENGVITFEVKFDTSGGHKSSRYADAVETVGGNGKENVVAIFQVGRVNKNGTPVSRERKAIEDIMGSKEYNGAPIYFIPYNSSDFGVIVYLTKK